MKAYLDNNILVSIEDNEINFGDIIRIYGNKISFVYSYVHILELLEATNKFDELKKIRFQTIKEIMNNYYIFPAGNKLSFKTESPEKVIFTLQVNDGLINYTRNLAKKFNIDRANIIKIFTFDEKRINNYEPDELIELLNKSSTTNLLIRFDNLIDLAGYALHERISTLFNLLDYVGFWKDKNTEKSNLSRLYDASHVFFASNCELFVSNDKRARNKAKVAFSFYNIDTKVLSFSEFMDYGL